jgi:hypothetical protein
MVEGKVDSSSFPIRAIKLSLLWRADRGSAHSTHPSREGTSSQPSPPSANYPDRPQCQECVLNLHLIPLLFLTNLANPTTLHFSIFLYLSPGCRTTQRHLSRRRIEGSLRRVRRRGRRSPSRRRWRSRRVFHSLQDQVSPDRVRKEDCQERGVVQG